MDVASACVMIAKQIAKEMPLIFIVLYAIRCYLSDMLLQLHGTGTSKYFLHLAALILANKIPYLVRHSKFSVKPGNAT